jgi:hypothetical protein
MSLKGKGDLSWKRQVGARGPRETDSGIMQRDEEWQGPASTFSDWVAGYEVGSAHPDFPLLKLTPPDPTNLEAGMMRCALKWVGGSANGDGIILGQGRTVPRKGGDRAPKSQSVNGTLKYRFDVTDETVPPGGRPTQSGHFVTGELPSNFTVSFYASTVNYRYGSTNYISVPKFEDLATEDLAAAGIEIYSTQPSESSSQTLKNAASGKRYVLKLKDGFDTGDGSPRQHVAYILPGDQRTLESRYFSAQWDVISSSDVVPTYVGRSVDNPPVKRRCTALPCDDRDAAGGVYAVTESWALEMEANIE